MRWEEALIKVFSKSMASTDSADNSSHDCNKEQNDQTDDCTEKFCHTLLDLPWQDVLWTKVLPYLSISDCFYLRQVNKEYKKMIDDYFISCSKLDLTDVADLSASCRQLTYLNLSGCTWLHNVGLVTIAYKCYFLEFLNINNCSNVTDEGIRTLVFHCQKMTTIKCKNVYQLTNYGVELMVKACPMMTKLDLRGCYRLTDRCIKLILEHGWNVRELKVKNCQSISEQSLFDIKDKIKVDVNSNTSSKNYFPKVFLQL
ncbi:FBXL2_20 [Acanthosepion pharaonis]|uniref:FBXL2_20 n=1 Tax=Acanthosepion pharaonis TaxID=158019 RepID=A0A812D288_ACAPH|nr:FBXL2_20 [Sepia pharaonis]